MRISSRLRLLFRNQRQYEVNYSVKNCLKNCSSTNPLVYWKERQRKHSLWKQWLKINSHITNTKRKPEGAQQFKAGVWLKSNIDFKSFQTIAPLLAIEKRQWGPQRNLACDQARIQKLSLKTKRLEQHLHKPPETRRKLQLLFWKRIATKWQGSFLLEEWMQGGIKWVMVTMIQYDRQSQYQNTVKQKYIYTFPCLVTIATNWSWFVDCICKPSDNWLICARLKSHVTVKVNIRNITSVLSVILFTPRNSSYRSFVCLRLRLNLSEETCAALDNYSSGIKKNKQNMLFYCLEWLIVSILCLKQRSRTNIFW